MNQTDDLKAYDAESSANVNNMFADQTVRDASQRWIDITGPYKYVYNWKWLGRPIIQLPADIVLTHELIHSCKPDVIIETGIARGGSIAFNASQLAMIELFDAQVCDLNECKRFCIGIDVEIREHNRLALERHPFAPMMRLVQGSSTDEGIVKQVKKLIPESAKVMVILDSNHTHEHVYKELSLYSELVSVGCPLVVHDTGIENSPPDLFGDRPWGKGDNPMSAVNQFLTECFDFERLEHENAKLLITSSPMGYLMRMR